MKLIAFKLALITVLYACSDNPSRINESNESISIKIIDDNFQGMLEYRDSLGVVKVQQEWKSGTQSGYTRVFNEEGLMILEEHLTDSSYQSILGESLLSCEIMPQALGEFYMNHLVIEFLDSISVVSPFEFKLLNVPEMCLTISVHGNSLRKTKKGWKVIPRTLEDTLKIDISAPFEHDRKVSRELRIPVRDK